MNISTIYLPSASLSSIFNGTPYLVFSASSLTQSIQIEQIVYKLVYNSQPYNASYDSGLYFYETASYGQSYVDNLYSGFINIDKNRVVTSTSGWTLNSASLYIKFEGNQAPTQGNTDLYIDIYYNTLNIDDRDPIFSFDKKGQFTEALEQGSAVTGSGRYSHAQGVSTYARASGSHAEGQSTTAYGNYSHAEGQTSVASGSHSHAEGENTIAIGRWSHAEGKATRTIGDYSHAEGINTIASGSGQLVAGTFNRQGNTTDLFVIGNGTDEGTRSDIFNVSTSSVNITGILNVSGSITGSLFGTASWATNAQTASFLPVGTYNITSSWAQSSSRATTASYAITASYAMNGGGGGPAFPYVGNAIITGSLLVSGSGTETYLDTATGVWNGTNIQIDANSGTISFSGSSQFAKALVYDTNGILITDENSVGSIQTSARGLYDVDTNLALTWYTSSNNGTRLYGTASYALTSSNLTPGTYNVTSSWANIAISTSYFSGSISNAVTADTASYVTASNVYGPFGSNSIQSASYALTSSYALNGGVTQIVAGTNISISPTSGTGSVTISSTGGGGVSRGFVIAMAASM